MEYWMIGLMKKFLTTPVIHQWAFAHHVFFTPIPSQQMASVINSH